MQRVDLDSADLVTLAGPEELLVIDDAIQKLASEDAAAAQFVRLRCFAGLSVEEAAELTGISRSSAYEHWAYARAWLYRELSGNPRSPTIPAPSALLSLLALKLLDKELGGAASAWRGCENDGRFRGRVDEYGAAQSNSVTGSRSSSTYWGRPL